MSLNYSFYVETSESRDQVIDSLQRAIRQSSKTESGILAPGLVVDVRVSDEEDIEYVKRRFQFEPNLTLYFHKLKFNDFEESDKSLVLAVLRLMDKGAGDSALEFDSGDILLRRVSGQILLNSGGDFWKPSILSFVDVPYKMSDDKDMASTSLNQIRQG